MNNTNLKANQAQYKTEDEAIALQLKDQKVSADLIDGVLAFRTSHRADESAADRIRKPATAYYGSAVWEMALAGLLARENLLLSGPKATGKNVLAENLAWVFGRPVFNMSFHVNTDSASLIGTDTFTENEVRFRRGPVYQCAALGGFGVFDEINMAKNDAVSVLHSALDHRRIIDVPGYERIYLAEETRFIATMNHGYAGTKELNEALVSRFLVVDMPAADGDTLTRIILDAAPDIKDAALTQFVGLFLDLQTKALNSEITTKPVDLRGLLAALKMIRFGLSASVAVGMGVTSKSFDSFERDIIDDIVLTRIPRSWGRSDVFE